MSKNDVCFVPMFPFVGAPFLSVPLPLPNFWKTLGHPYMMLLWWCYGFCSDPQRFLLITPLTRVHNPFCVVEAL